MTIDANKALVRRFIDEVFVQGRRDSVDELVAADFVAHNWPSTGDGRADLKAAIGRIEQGLSDIGFTVDDLVAEGDRVAVRVTSSAVQSGPFMGLPPSGRRYEIPEIHIFRIADGRIAEHWYQMDAMGLMRQLGPTDGS